MLVVGNELTVRLEGQKKKKLKTNHVQVKHKGPILLNRKMISQRRNTVPPRPEKLHYSAFVNLEICIYKLALLF